MRHGRVGSVCIGWQLLIYSRGLVLSGTMGEAEAAFADDSRWGWEEGRI